MLLKTLPNEYIRDFAGRALLASWFAVFAALKMMQVLEVVRQFDATAWWTMTFISNIATLAFLVLIVATTAARLPPKGSAEGIEPRVSALLGAFFTLTLVVLPPIEISTSLRVISMVLIIVGSALCVWCLYWLGRSFSIMAQARRLVTGGPYGFVRHPLYVCELVTLAGVILAKPSWLALVIACIALAFQYRRIINEERTLTRVFPEYATYAARTPMLLPFGRVTPTLLRTER